MDLSALAREIRKEIRDLEAERHRLDARLDEKHKMLARIEEVLASAGAGIQAGPPVHVPGPAAGAHLPAAGGAGILVGNKRTTSSFGRHHYEVDGQQFAAPGKLLDHFNWRHYFSTSNGGKGDVAHREIFRFARRNPALAKKILIVSAAGSMSLYDAVQRLWP